MADGALDDPFYSAEELKALGFAHVGRNTRVSRLARFYAIRGGTIGEHTRIDDFAVLKGQLEIGAFVHISAFCLVSGVGGVVRMDDFSGLSAYTAVYTASDDYHSGLLTNPTVPADLTDPLSGDIHLAEGCILGAHCVVMPGTVVGEYAAIGAHCVARGVIEAAGIVVSGSGRPRRIGARNLETLKVAAAEARRRARES